MTSTLEHSQNANVASRVARPTAPPASGECLFSRSQRLDYLRQFGTHSQHFTGLQRGMRYFDVAGVGYVAFRSHWGRAVVLGDPVTSSGDTEGILARFLKAYPAASFLQVGASVAMYLNTRWRYYGTQFGVEQRVPLGTWTVSGKSRKCIRKAVNRARESEIRIEESDRPLLADGVSDAWLKTRPTGGREIEFLVRPREMKHIEGMRYFHATQNDKVIGFAYFDPGFSHGKIVSYMPNISRGNADFSQGLFYTIMVHAMEVFRKEGVQWLELGLSPMVLESKALRFESRILRSAFKLIYQHGRHYNFQGLYFTKTRFGGNWSPTYYCHRRALPVGDLCRLTALTGLLRPSPHA